jgi:hypothetical protein
MKVCEKCEREIYTRDGENVCTDCQNAIDCDAKNKAKNARRRANAAARRAALESCGLKRVRGALGGIYWE